MSKKGAGDETRTRDINLGKVALYQLSYTRVLARRQRYPSRGVGSSLFLKMVRDRDRRSLPDDFPDIALSSR